MFASKDSKKETEKRNKTLLIEITWKVCTKDMKSGLKTKKISSFLSYLSMETRILNKIPKSKRKFSIILLNL